MANQDSPKVFVPVYGEWLRASNDAHTPIVYEQIATTTTHNTQPTPNLAGAFHADPSRRVPVTQNPQLCGYNYHNSSEHECHASFSVTQRVTLSKS